MAGERDLRAARRYATALFAVAEKQNKLDAVTRDLNMMVGLMEKTPALDEMWSSKVVPAGKKRDLVGTLFAASIDPLTLSFLRLLVAEPRNEVGDPVYPL